MFICRRLLQLGTLSALLAGCSTTAPSAPNSLTTASTAASANTAIRIGPTTPTPGSELPDDAPATLTATGALRPEVRSFVEDLAAERQLPLDPMVKALESSRYNATVSRLIAPAAPGKKIWRSWLTYRSRFVEPKRIGWGVEFYNENRDLLNQAAQRFGVPAPIIASIIGVETLYGRNMGNFRVLDALATLAFDYPDPNKPERAAMFRGQLADFLTLVMKDKLELETRGSYAGAIGMPQFMPTSIMHYAVDGDDNGHIDLTNNTQDAIMSVGSFLAQHGWQRGLPVFAPVVLPADPTALVDGGLEPKQTWSTLSAAGARLQPGASSAGWGSQPLGVVDLVEEARGTAQYRVGTPNFFALTKYNRSYFYATSVADLAYEIEARVTR
ncbi:MULTISPECIES: lytic murein transglycosylase B [Achromobacter]|uniref:Membrane-bound lytic murein transglycosylase B n=1 Tax=Achromobacter piechaudii TaxID=72556 RepID=A0ABM8L0H6_9BURK|nr:MULTISPECIES: lytic murein transglycosylase B [Achromobacter]KNY12135.1 murein transglycosylase [Achromobacter piechaudii]MPS79120.1 lytic murein transglycosylase B [Achromobacter sp.]CAB3718934.1 Membrane-bound lytic murein transglycosylase B [Achromobacter piechaudii]CAB3888159.1 Membrane-bound lytic murein transglycosylase B [Achromobacter piechaudii]CAB3951883.1 Membrane-bound lytic murein transglycosylase B [Achromobacter piechaudii]